MLRDAFARIATRYDGCAAGVLAERRATSRLGAQRPDENPSRAIGAERKRATGPHDIARMGEADEFEPDGDRRRNRGHSDDVPGSCAVRRRRDTNHAASAPDRPGDVQTRAPRANRQLHAARDETIARAADGKSDRRLGTRVPPRPSQRAGSRALIAYGASKSAPTQSNAPRSETASLLCTVHITAGLDRGPQLRPPGGGATGRDAVGRRARAFAESTHRWGCEEDDVRLSAVYPMRARGRNSGCSLTFTMIRRNRPS